MRTMMRRMATVGLALGLAITGSPARAAAQAPAEPLPAGEAVLARYVDATGGVAAYDAVRNRVVHARMEFVGTGIVLALTVYSAPPASLYTLVEGEAVGRVESGVSDGVAWETSARRGAAVRAGVEREDAVRDAVFNRLAHWKDHLKSVQCTGVEEVNGRPAFRVMAVPKQGSVQALFFDRESGLLVRSETSVTTGGNTMSVVAEPGDYRSVDGVLVPFTSRMRVLGQERVVMVDSVEHNVLLPADRFALPPEIKALVKK